MKKFLVVFIIIIGTLVIIDLRKTENTFVTPLLLLNTAISSIINEDYVKLEKSVNNSKYIHNSETKEGFTLLMFAALKNDTKAMDILIKSGEDINYQNKDNGETALMYAVTKNAATTKMLLEQPNIKLDLTDIRGNTFLHFATINNNPNLFNKLKEKFKDLARLKNNNQLTPMELQVQTLRNNLLGLEVPNFDISVNKGKTNEK